jgi:hypothetical protein
MLEGRRYGVRSRAAGLVTCLSLLGAGVTGCGSDDPGASAPTSAPSAGQEPPSTAGSPSPEPPEPSEPSEPSEPIVAMTGPEITVADLERDVFRFRLPEGDWSLSYRDQTASTTTRSNFVSITGQASLSDAPVSDAYVYRDEARNLALESSDPRKVGERTVDGVEGLAFRGTKGQLFYSFVSRHDGVLLTIQFRFFKDTPKARQWIDAVLATGEWL